ncbi:MAG: 3-methyl-2-oxobutanoate hydroxymethyltransferase [Desulfurococcales archaeon]|nr:3-methyl-2-oxobutanoate hydroxymethyltransferase [Desulfurococcales archaeon]
MQEKRKKMTARRIMKMKGREKIAMVTAYTYHQARLADEAGIDAILVGDSLGMVIYGYPTTLQVTLQDMIRHTQAVANAKPRALIVTDMPIGTYEPSTRDAVISAIQLARAGAEAVKLEGGTEYTDRVKAIVQAGIPVMGHIGLTPQRHLRIGGYKQQGKTPQQERQLIQDALALQEAGAFAIVIEYTNPDVAKKITGKLEIPTICIGAGPHCDGQVLVLHDLLGITPNPPPFTKQYANLQETIKSAIKQYINDIKRIL